MLTLALLTGGDTSALPAFTGLAAPGRPLLVIDQGSQGADRDALRLFVEREGAAFLPLDAPLSPAEASALARRETGAEYVLALGCDDRVNREGLETLEQGLQDTRPDLAIMPPGWWLAGGPLPGLDAAPWPDPRRLLIRGGACDTPDPGGDPRAAWEVWDRTADAPGQTLHHPDPVLLRPLPRHGAAPTLAAIAALVVEAPNRRRAAVLTRALPRLAGALTLAPPETAGETMTAATRLLRALPRSLRRQACAAPAPAGRFLNALHKGHPEAALAHLSLLATVRSDMQTRALAAEYAALRADLDAALPGPAYLRDLHARLRGG